GMLAQHALQRGSHNSVAELRNAIVAFVEARNESLKPFAGPKRFGVERRLELEPSTLPALGRALSDLATWASLPGCGTATARSAVSFNDPNSADEEVEPFGQWQRDRRLEEPGRFRVEHHSSISGKKDSELMLRTTRHCIERRVGDANLGQEAMRIPTHPWILGVC